MGPRRRWLLIIFVVGLLFFSFSWKNPFVFDDIIKIKENADLKPGSSIAETLLYPYKSNVTNMLRNDPSRPLTFLIYRLGYALGDGASWPFHTASSLFHSLSACLVFLLVGLISRRSLSSESLLPGILAAFFFLFLPINSGTVLYAYAFSDVLAAFFLLAALYIFSLHSSAASTLASLGLFIGALLSKQSAIVLPVLLLLTDFFLNQINKKRMISYLGFGGVALAYLALRYSFFGGIGDLEGTGNTFAPLPYLQLQGAMILKYLWLAVVPFGLALDHAPNPAQFPAESLLTAWLVVLMMTGLSLFFLFKKSTWPALKLLSWTWLFFFITLLPTSSLLPTVDLFVERRAYLGSVALAALFGILLSWIPRRRISATAGAVVLLFYSLMSWGRSQVYSSPEALWNESAALYPTSKRALINLGVIYDEQGRYDEALALFEKVRAQFPGDAFIQTKAALIYQNPNYRGHDMNKALEAYQKSLAINPNDVVTLYNAGLLMLDMKNFAQAEALFRRSLDLNPRFPYGMMGLGMTLVYEGKVTEGKNELKKASEIDPHLSGAQGFLQQIEK